MTNTWRTRPDGLVEVNGAIPALDGGNLAALKSQVFRWVDSAKRHGAAYGVPVHWVLGLIFAESGGRPTVVSADGGYGLMQLTHPSVFAGHAKEETLSNPDLNIQLGTKLMRTLIDGMGSRADLARVASGYNAGTSKGMPHPSTVSPWGMRETKGHIDHTVAAANSALALLPGVASPPQQGPPPKAPSPAPELPILTLGMLALRTLLK